MKNGIKLNKVPVEVESLKQQLGQVRRESLLATRQNDFRRVAKLTAQAATLNKAIIEAQGLIVHDLA